MSDLTHVCAATLIRHPTLQCRLPSTMACSEGLGCTQTTRETVVRASWWRDGVRNPDISRESPTPFACRLCEEIIVRIEPQNLTRCVSHARGTTYVESCTRPPGGVNRSWAAIPVSVALFILSLSRALLFLLLLLLCHPTHTIAQSGRCCGRPHASHASMRRPLGGEASAPVTARRRVGLLPALPCASTLSMQSITSSRRSRLCAQRVWRCASSGARSVVLSCAACASAKWRQVAGTAWSLTRGAEPCMCAFQSTMNSTSGGAATPRDLMRSSVSRSRQLSSSSSSLSASSATVPIESGTPQRCVW